MDKRDWFESLLNDSAKGPATHSIWLPFEEQVYFEEACGASYRTGRQMKRPMTSPHSLLSPSAPSYRLNKGYVKMLCLFEYAKD